MAHKRIHSNPTNRTALDSQDTRQRRGDVRRVRGGAVKLVGSVLGFGFAVLCAAAETSTVIRGRRPLPIRRVTRDREIIRGGLFTPDRYVVTETTRVYDDEDDLRWNDPSKVTQRTIEVEAW